MFMSCQRMVKSTMLRANFNYSAPWKAQASRMIEQVCILVRTYILSYELLLMSPQAAERQPFLRRFANDWATKAYMMIYLKNRRNYLRKQERLGLEPEPDNESDEDNLAADAVEGAGTGLGDDDDDEEDD
jgi:hypothetical protein